MRAIVDGAVMLAIYPLLIAVDLAYSCGARIRGLWPEPNLWDDHRGCVHSTMDEYLKCEECKDLSF